MERQDIFDAAKAAYTGQPTTGYSVVSALLAMFSEPKRDGVAPTGYEDIDKLVSKLKEAGCVFATDVPNRGDENPWSHAAKLEIHMPQPTAFDSPSFYAHALLHEMCHVLDVKLRGPKFFNARDMMLFSPKYAIEEFAAELTVFMLSEQLNLGFREQALGYIGSWIANMKAYAPEEYWPEALELAKVRMHTYLTWLGKA